MAIGDEVKFDEADLERASVLLKEGHVKNIIFSNGTYQVEVLDDGEYWIFMQIDDDGHIQDQFCTCEAASQKGTCQHLAAGFLAIFRGNKYPLHIRFKTSFWKRLLQVVAKREGYTTECIKKEGSVYTSSFVRLEVKRAQAQEKAKELIDERKEETEETSLKFSNLDPSELELYRKGRPSLAFQYELSFWSDLAKWMMVLEDQQGKPEIYFAEGGSELPKTIYIKNDEFELQYQIDANDWPDLIPSLVEYDTNLKVFEFKDIIIEEIRYNEGEKSFQIHSKPIEIEKGGRRIEWEDWTFVEGVGFFSKKSDPILKQRVIEEADIPLFIEKYSRFIEKYLVGTAISKKAQEVSYHLFFDDAHDLHITIYLFEPDDFSKPNSALFNQWAYIEGRGFFRLGQRLFKGLEKVIPKDYIDQFIEKNRLWLNKIDKFQIHLASIEMKMTYRLDDEALILERDDSLFDQAKEVIDFGSWVYVKGQGFYSRAKMGDKKGVLQPAIVAREEISDYIHEMRDELEQVPGFFFSESGLEKTGLVIKLDEESRVVIEPRYYFKQWALDKTPKIFGDFVYIKEKGFTEIPDPMKIPKKYARNTIIQPDELPYFIKQELTRLKPYILHIDNRLIQPHTLKLTLMGARLEDKEWHMQLAYKSAYGVVSIQEVYESLLRFSQFILSDAGMIELKDKRFHWLMKLAKSAFNPETGELKLSTLDWIRLSVIEDVRIPTAEDPKVEAVYATLRDLQGLHISEMPNIKYLQSKLRPYQEIGVRWLWFLYTYGLSGFLCDDMGLGKTHQAMGLIAAVIGVKRKTERSKFLVVCPTSVVYHWQDLLEKFLPKIKTHVYHGPFRSGKELKLKKDLILTTYGILRSDKELFAKMKFEVAIFDEMQVAKNEKSQIHGALKNIQAEMKLALTGTPIENYLTELKSLFDIILPGFLPSAQEFKEEFVAPIEKGGDKERQKSLKALINPFILRRKKQDVLDDLPDKIEEIAYVDLSDEQRQLYDEIAVQSKSILNEDDKDFYMHVFALLNKLKQVCNHPAQVYKDTSNFEAHQSGKWDLFVELLEEARASKQKLVVFSQYLDMLDIIENYLKQQNISFAGIRGSTRDRKEQVYKFQNDPNCEVFVGSLQAAGVGITLTAASVVIHYDRWWNPAKENQATDRVHRIGQNRGVSVFKLVTKHTIEEHIHHLIEKKKDLIQNIIGFDDENAIKKLDREELSKLVKLIYQDVI